MRISERENSSRAEEGRDKNTHPKNKNLGGEKKKMNKITNKKTFALLLSVILVISAIAAVMPAIATPLSPDDTEITSALDYLQSVQSGDGDIGGFNPSAWAVMGIAAAGEDPHEWNTAPGNPSLVDYLKGNSEQLAWEFNTATGYERMILGIVAACEDPSAFGEGDPTYAPDGDYLSKLKELHDGTQFVYEATHWYPPYDTYIENQTLNDDFWGVLALIAAGEDSDSEMIQSTVAFIKENQGTDGGWSWATLDNYMYSGSNVDDTAAAIMALIAAGESPDSPVINAALGYLHNEQDDSGGFGFEDWYTGELVVNSASTAWAIQAIVAAGQDPTSEDWTLDGNPVNVLLSFQEDTGAFIWYEDCGWSGCEAREKMTSYAIPALLGTPYPVPCPRIPAGVTFDQKKIKLNSNGKLKAFITLPEGYDATVADINVSTVTCEEAPVIGSKITGKGVLEAKFEIQKLNVSTGGEVRLTVKGKLYDGTPFKGCDTIRVI